MGLGDVASILLPGVKIIQSQYLYAKIDVLTYGAGVELMALVPEVNAVLAITKEQWPSDIAQATISFMGVAEVVIQQDYDLVINLDTWFMPCFLARTLKDSGLHVEGNFTQLSVVELFEGINRRGFTQSYFQSPHLFLASTYERMDSWHTPWWNQYPNQAYPEFYLNYCCGFDAIPDFTLEVESDSDFKSSAQGKKIVALSLSGSKPSKQYQHASALRDSLEQAGFYVWSQFDGSVEVKTTLARLKVTDLLVTVATSTQWFAKLVGCPSLMISGPLPPSVLGAELNATKVESCQYCFQGSCVENRDFACLDVQVQSLVTQISGYFRAHV